MGVSAAGMGDETDATAAGDDAGTGVGVATGAEE
jgi:hypothetical protein